MLLETQTETAIKAHARMYPERQEWDGYSAGKIYKACPGKERVVLSLSSLSHVHLSHKLVSHPLPPLSHVTPSSCSPNLTQLPFRQFYKQPIIF